MIKFNCNGTFVYYIQPDEDIDNSILRELTNSYCRVESQPTNHAKNTMLIENGFTLVDRTIQLGIPLTQISNDWKRLTRLEVKTEYGICEEMREIARRAFTDDRRFFVKDNEINNNNYPQLAYQLLDEYISWHDNAKCKVFSCYNKGKVVGFIIASILSDTECETILGAVLPEYQKLGVGISLYAYEFQYFQQRCYKKLYSRISTANIASLNMHLKLIGSGAQTTFLSPLDIYIREPKEDMKVMR